MENAAREPLLKKCNWAAPGLVITYSLFGVVSFVGQRILSSLILKNRIDVSTYQGVVYNFNLINGIIFSIALAVFFAACILGSSGSRRAGFIVGSVSSLAPVFGALSTTILFKLLGLPSMGAGSVIASAISALLIVLPYFIMIIIFAFCKKLRLKSRLLALLVAFISLLVAFFPVVVTVFALVLMPDNPLMFPLMQISAYVIHVRPLVIALGIGLVYFMNRDNGRQEMGSLANEIVI